MLGLRIVASGAALFAAEPAAQTVTIKGYVRDSACPFTKGLTKPISAECATGCAKAGSPLVILAPSGTIYWPISDATPSTSQEQKLLPYAGQQVVVSGKTYHRGGSMAIVVSKIEAASAKK